MVILEVPEFQYDVVKFKGAVWDDKIKKWCADRKHLNALCEWIPYYKESYYYGKEIRGINNFELQEFDKFFDNNIDIINQYLYLCIANIICIYVLRISSALIAGKKRLLCLKYLVMNIM